MTRQEFDKLYGVRDDGQIHHGPVNIDGMTIDELEIAAYHPALHHDVRRYAVIMVEAWKLRVSGKVDRACELSDRADRMYKSFIPAACRW